MDWISCEERLPEEDDQQFIICLSYPNGTFVVREVHWFRGKWRGTLQKEVTHWIPMPPPPGDNDPTPVEERSTDPCERCKELEAEKVGLLEGGDALRACLDLHIAVVDAARELVGDKVYGVKPKDLDHASVEKLQEAFADLDEQGGKT